MVDKETAPTPDVVDEALFRQCRRLPDGTKEKIRQMVNIWGKDE